VSLREKIEQEIRQRGPIPFSRYMEMCLYDPELGYYSRDVERFGKAGDFYTSSDVHAVFGRLLARQFAEIWRVLGSPKRIEVLELGPGRGLFARDVLDWSEKKLPEFFQALQYSLVERSAALRERLRSSFSRHFESGKASIPQRLKPHESREQCGTLRLRSGQASEAVPFPGWPSRMEKRVTSPLPTDNSRLALQSCEEKNRKATTLVLPNRISFERALAPDVPMIIFANEFFDALPVEVLSPQGELRIAVCDDRLVETWAPPSSEELEYLDRYSIHPEDGERVELPLRAQSYMSAIAAAVKHGIAIIIDYGYTREEQLAGRHRGTVMAFRQHSVSTNPYEAPGEQDITAHVNFTALAAVQQEGMHVQPLLTQSQFLMGIGEHNQFADAFEDCRFPQERAKVALQLKHLITPAGMGESFHVLVGSKGVEVDQFKPCRGLRFGGGQIER
jgi:SAM-dependent MidA family methyltransferase